MRILNAEPDGYSDEAREILQSLGEYVGEYTSQSKLKDRVRDYDILIVRVGLRVTRDILESSKKLKIIISATTGLDHIDIKAAKEYNIKVLSLQGETDFLKSIPATAEHTWAILLSLIRHIPSASAHVKKDEWNRDRFKGNELCGKNLGILGLGRIGEQIASYGLTFGMNVGAYDPHRSGWVQNVRQFESLEAMLQWSSVLTVHLPLREGTHGLLNEERLRLLPKGAWIINTARGALIDESALVKLLEEEYLNGAAVDVICNEQPPDERLKSPLTEYAKAHDNLIITPHIGGATIESMKNTEIFMAKKLHNHLKRI